MTYQHREQALQPMNDEARKTDAESSSSDRLMRVSADQLVEFALLRVSLVLLTRILMIRHSHFLTMAYYKTYKKSN